MNARNKVQVMLVVMLLLLTAVLPAAAQDEEPLTEEEKANLAVVEKFFALYNDQDGEAIGELLTDDVVWTRTDPGEYLWLGSRTGEGVEGALAVYADDQSNTMWNMWVSLVDARVEGDTVQTLELWENDLLRQLRTPLVERSTFHIRDGKIADWEAAFTELGTQRVLERADRDTVVNSFAEILSIGHLEEALTYVADDAVFVFPLDPLTGKRVEVTGKESIAAYLEQLAAHRLSYTLSDLYSHPRHLQGYGYVTWNELKAMGLPSLPTNDRFEVTDGKVVRFEMLPLALAQRLYAVAAAGEANKETVRSAVEAFISADADAIATYYAEDAVRREMSIVDEGSKAIQLRAELLRAGFDDFACTQDKLTASGDQVFVHGICTGTVSAAVEEPSVTGKTVTFAVIGVYTLKDGKIVEESVVYDTADVWRQLGFELVPAE